MQTNYASIDGNAYARMLVGAAASLAAHAEELNALNVFPVSDGDTGSNMLKTVEGGLRASETVTDGHIGRLTQAFARGALLAARGNSGVILSQIFAGIAETLDTLQTADAAQLARAYENGIDKAYAVVRNPTEGTILTVFRESTREAAQAVTQTSAVADFFRLHVESARSSLQRTPSLLPVLREAGVVDSGAAGYVYIAEGMYRVLTGDTVSYDRPHTAAQEEPDIDRFTRDSVLTFGYCTEFLLRLTTDRVDPDTFRLERVLAVLEELDGQSVVAYQQGDVVKVHVHTFRPGDVLSRMQQFGEFLTIKIENMALGHSERIAEKKNTRNFSVVAVASGDGLDALFTQMGADRVIRGGQTDNPSIEAFLDAFRACDGADIIVLPNHKNILLAAQQAAQLYREASVHVLETTSMMQGYSALSVITPGITDMHALLEGARRAAQSVADGAVTRAVRDATLGDVCVHCGDYIAISGGQIVAVADSAEQAAMDMLEKFDTDLAEIVTVFVGAGVSDARRAALTAQIERQYDMCRVAVYEGGQDVYDYLIGLE